MMKLAPPHMQFQHFWGGTKNFEPTRRESVSEVERKGTWLALKVET